MKRVANYFEKIAFTVKSCFLYTKLKVIVKLSESLKKRNQNKLEESIECSEFDFDYVHLLYHKCYKINPNREGPYIDSTDWIRKSNNKFY